MRRGREIVRKNNKKKMRKKTDIEKERIKVGKGQTEWLKARKERKVKGKERRGEGNAK